MTPAPAFLAVDHVLAIHRRVVAEFGGSAELGDRGLLESAVTMPAAAFGGDYLHAGLPAMAAAFLFHICRNHPFVDGNKRTAVVAAEVFLMLNGMRLRAADDAIEELARAIAAGTVGKEEVVAFFQRHVERG
jgi:death-on-curing protein